MACYVFDTSALLAYLQNEEGVEIVQQLFLDGIKGKHKIVINVLSLVELYYKACREVNEIFANQFILDVKALPLTIVPFDVHLVKKAGIYKATGKMSFADACIASTAKHLNAILVHKDPEYLTIQDIEQLPLPFKPKIMKS